MTRSDAGPPRDGGAREGCGLDTSFAGDELCLSAPPSSEGVLVHVGPDDYDDPDSVAPFLVRPGAEEVGCYNVLPHRSKFHYFEQHNRARPGIHHMIIRATRDESLDEGPSRCGVSGFAGTSLPGALSTRRDIVQEHAAPENASLARYLPEGALQYELHYLNTSDEPILREAWTTLHFVEEGRVRDRIDQFLMIGGLTTLEVPPRSQQRVAYECQVPERARLLSLYGHFHSHTERLTAWRIRDGQRQLIYEEYDWVEPTTLVYDSVTDNAPPDPSTRTTGGYSGPLVVQPDDTIRWECDVHNTLDQPLRFANDALEGEMCLLFGSSVSEGPVPNCLIP